MIDYVRLGMDIEIPEEEFDWTRFRTGILKDETVIWYHRFRGVWVRYYPMRRRITVTGKILMLLEDSEVLNVDDVYGLDIPQFVCDINDYLSALFKTIRLDILYFYAYRIDYCFNVYTPHVAEYVHFMNDAFRQVDNGARINYTLHKHLDGSVYIKTKSDYNHNERRNYVLNFYDKADRLKYLHDRKYKIPTRDFEFAQDNLRLEVQCGFLFIKRLCKKYRIQPLFGNLLDYEIAYYAEKSIYKLIFRSDDTQDYYTYSEAKKRLPRSEAAAHTLRTASQGHKIIDSKYNYGRELIKKTGVFPFCFLPRDGKLSMLENPLKLIQRKLKDIGVDMSLL